MLRLHGYWDGSVLRLHGYWMVFETLHATSLRKAVVGVVIEMPRYDVSTIMDG